MPRTHEHKKAMFIHTAALPLLCKQTTSVCSLADDICTLRLVNVMFVLVNYSDE